MTIINNLNDSLNKSPIDNETKLTVIENLWPLNTAPRHQGIALDCDAYFSYYARQCHDALIDQGQRVLARTHIDIIDIVRQLENSIPRADIKESLRLKLVIRNRPNEEEILDNTVDMAARLYTMLNIAIKNPVISRQAQLRWQSGDLKSFLSDYFNEPPQLGSDGTQLERTFTALNLQRIAGIQIKFTDNLADHLRMIDKDDKVVAIFHHISFLKQQNNSTIYPIGLAEETLNTLSLLFPPHDAQTKRWLSRSPEFHRIDKSLLKCEPLWLDQRQIEKFHFWHDRLVILKQAFDQARPSTISQWWFDRRNGVQWYTFWVAILVLFLTIFFGMVQSIEGALQVYKTFNPN